MCVHEPCDSTNYDKINISALHQMFHNTLSTYTILNTFPYSTFICLSSNWSTVLLIFCLFPSFDIHFAVTLRSCALHLGMNDWKIYNAHLKGILNLSTCLTYTAKSRLKVTHTHIRTQAGTYTKRREIISKFLSPIQVNSSLSWWQLKQSAVRWNWDKNKVYSFCGFANIFSDLSECVVCLCFCCNM